MMNLLKKLDRQAGTFVDTMDHNLQEPFLRAMSGEVFVDEKSQNELTRPAQARPQAVKPVNRAAAETRSTDTGVVPAITNTSA